MRAARPLFRRAWVLAIGGALFASAGCSLLDSLDPLSAGNASADASGDDVTTDAPSADGTSDDATTDASSELPPPPATGWQRAITIKNLASGDMPPRLHGRASHLIRRRSSPPARCGPTRPICASSTRMARSSIASSTPGRRAPSGSRRRGASPQAAATRTRCSTARRMPGRHPRARTACSYSGDDFANGMLNPQWIVNGNPIVGNGTLTLRAGQQDALTTNASTDSVPTINALEIVAKVTDPSSAAQTTPNGDFYHWFGYQHTGDFTPSEPWIGWIARAPGVVWAEQSISGSPSCSNTCQPQTPLTQDTSYHSYVIQRAPSATRFLRDGTSFFTVGDPTTTDYSLMLRNWALRAIWS